MPKPFLYLAGFIEDFADDLAYISCADRSTIQISRILMPAGAQIGDFIVQIDEEGHFRIDREITEMRQREIRRMSDSYFG